ncbi:MAG: IS4 family transposase [Phycisphaerae bacterium]|nr:IS4 family transposase [Phycisphaerae bacterium]
MSKDIFDKSSVKTLNVFDKLHTSALNSIRKVLPDSIISKACQQCNYHYRNRLLTPTIIVLHMIMAAIWPEESFNASWQTMWATTVACHPETPGNSPARGSVANARNRLPLEIFLEIFDWLSSQCQKLSKHYDKWKGHRVILVDGTCLTTADNKKLHEEFVAPKGYHGKGRYPLARVVALSLSNTMAVIAYNVGKYTTSENSLLAPMLKKLRKGDILLGDRHYAGANLYCRYLNHGLEFLTRMHQAIKISKIKPCLVYDNNDFIGYLKVNKIHRLADSSLPEKIKVRFMMAEIMIRGRKKQLWFVTSLLDAQKYPANQIIALYADRWRIETLFRELKVNLHSNVLRSQKVVGVYREIAAHFSALNIIRCIMLESAIEKNIEDPIRLSFSNTVRVILAFAPVLAAKPIEQLPAIYQAMLREIALCQTPWRPERIEPRAISHEPKSYSKLKGSREQWKTQNVA